MNASGACGQSDVYAVVHNDLWRRFVDGRYLMGGGDSASSEVSETARGQIFLANLDPVESRYRSAFDMVQQITERTGSSEEMTVCDITEEHSLSRG